MAITFWAITVIGVVALIALATLVPRQTSAVEQAGSSGEAGAFTYIAYTLTRVSGFANTSVAWLLILFGLGLFVGNIAGAKAADKALSRTLTTVLVGLTAVMVMFALTAHNQLMTIICLILMGAFGFATVPGLQMRIMNYAAQAPTLASGANIAAFNLGNALGAWIGGVTIAAGLGFTAPIWAGATLTAAGLGVLLIADKLAHPKPTTCDCSGELPRPAVSTPAIQTGA